MRDDLPDMMSVIAEIDFHTFPLFFWAGFVVFILVMVALDLGVFHRKSHVVSFREALMWTTIWFLLASAFCAWLWFRTGKHPETGRNMALEFFTGYLIELSLSADNVFIFALIFRSFGVPAQYQHKVLIWGVLSALVLRFVMIAAGVALIHRFEWVILLFGAFLVFTGVKMLFASTEMHEDPTRNSLVRLAQRKLPCTPTWVEDHFFARVDGRLFITPLLLVLICIEISDVIFAVDSIPAIFGVTTDPFLVFTSNVFAIMGLRSLYFVLSGVIDKFHYLKPALGVVLSFVGIKMLLGKTQYKISTELALIVTVSVLAVAIIASILFPKRIIPEDGTNAGTDEQR